VQKTAEPIEMCEHCLRNHVLDVSRDRTDPFAAIDVASYGRGTWARALIALHLQQFNFSVYFDLYKVYSDYNVDSRFV